MLGFRFFSICAFRPGFAVKPSFLGRYLSTFVTHRPACLLAPLTFSGTTTYEKSHASVTTGLFQVQIVGVGRLVVHCDLELIGELDGEVTNLQIDALQRGPLAAKFTASLQKRYESIRNSLLQSAYPHAVLRRERVYDQWRDVLRRVLYRAKEFRHGAAFILTNRRRVAAINCKYSLSYSMLSEHFEHMIYNGCLEGASGGSITDDSTPALEFRGRAVERRFYSSWGEDAERALASSIFFVATLARVDGVVLLDKSLTVLGFGGEIRSTSDAACQIVRVRSNPGSAGRPVYEPIDITTFGQRHRSIGCGICHFKRWTSPSIHVAREPIAHVGPYPTFSVVWRESGSVSQSFMT